MNVVIYVEGGVVQGVRADTKETIGVEVFDVDNKEAEGKSRDRINREWKKVEKAYPMPIY